MTDNLLDLTTKKLLEKFGAGEHKPGSGSASAFQGMLSAMLLTTVIDLTNNPSRQESYKIVLPELLRIKGEIHSRVYPKLAKLFQDDSDQFDIVIKLRRERDEVTKTGGPLLYNEKANAANQALRLATEIPIAIANACYEIGRYAVYVFDNGFRSARGDSGVALNGATLAMASCLSVIELNLIKLPGGDWMKEIRKEKALVKSNYLELLTLCNSKLVILENEAKKNWEFHEYFSEYRSGILGASVGNADDMESLVKTFQNKIWIQRDKIWKKGAVKSAMEVLKPKDIVEKVLGYTFLESESLGAYIVGTDVFEVAGLIDRSKKLISISKQFPGEIMNFTAAHELGHLILHKDAILHRDRPVDGATSIPKDPQEQQADKFAACFLMPASIVKEVFFEIFEQVKFHITEDTVLGLSAGSIESFRTQCKDKRGLALELAQIEHYKGKSFNSLAQIFHVTPNAMSFRLMELNLVVF